MDRAFYRESVDDSGLKKRSSPFTNGTRVPIWNARTVGIPCAYFFKLRRPMKQIEEGDTKKLRKSVPRPENLCAHL
jgi:hypothetical protein